MQVCTGLTDGINEERRYGPGRALGCPLKKNTKQQQSSSLADQTLLWDIEL